MVQIKSADVLILDKLFGMKSGYILDFKNEQFADFFMEELGVDIYHPLYEGRGTSKGKRLHAFLQLSETARAVQALEALWSYREKMHLIEGYEDNVKDSARLFAMLIENINGKKSSPSVKVAKADIALVDVKKASELEVKLIALEKLEPQARGYAFEEFLKNCFELYGLEPRAAFKLTGEQIDGSFKLMSETYLLEAKWQNSQTGASDLRNFQGKLLEKATWSRGLFISNSGFTIEGLVSFGRGKSIICMDGLDLYYVLNNNLNLAKVLELKTREAAETGAVFTPVRDLLDRYKELKKV